MLLARRLGRVGALRTCATARAPKTEGEGEGDELLTREKQREKLMEAANSLAWQAGISVEGRDPAELIESLKEQKLLLEAEAREAEEKVDRLERKIRELVSDPQVDQSLNDLTDQAEIDKAFELAADPANRHVPLSDTDSLHAHLQRLRSEASDPVEIAAVRSHEGTTRFKKPIQDDNVNKDGIVYYLTNTSPKALIGVVWAGFLATGGVAYLVNKSFT